MQGRVVSVPAEHKQTSVAQLLCDLKQCVRTRDLSRGEALHKEAISAGLHTDKYVAAVLITMYGKCSQMFLAKEVFNVLHHRDVVIWNSLIMGYVETGQSSIALELFTLSDCQPSPVTFVAVLKACGAFSLENNTHELFSLEKGITLHKHIKALRFDSNDVVLSNALIAMYSRCGSMLHAIKVFESSTTRDAVTWNSLIQGYVENGESLRALEVFFDMDCSPTSVTYVAALKACGMLACESDPDTNNNNNVAILGLTVHQLAKEHGHEHDLTVSNSLVAMYTRLRDMRRAKVTFDTMNSRSDVSWNTLISGYVEIGEAAVALDLFYAMDCQPTPVTFTLVLKACGGLEKQTEKSFGLVKGGEVHREIRRRGLESNVVVVNSLTWMYTRCGSVRLAREALNRMKPVWNVVTWNSLLTACVEYRQYTVAIDLFTGMDCQPNSTTYALVLKAYGSSARAGKFTKEFCLAVGNALVDAYCKCSDVQRAREVSDGMTHRDVATWTSLMLGYTDNGDSPSALQLYDTMDCQPSSVTYVAALKACGASASLVKGLCIYQQLNRRGLISDLTVSTTLLDMLTKCRDMQRAREVFDAMSSPSLVSWTSLILGHVRNGELTAALEVFASMDCELSSLAYVALLKASIGTERQTAVRMISAIHKRVKSRGLDSDTPLANALVDMYTKCGDLPRAKEAFDKMTHRDVVTWNSLMLGYLESREFPQALELFRRMDCEPSSVTYVAALKAYGGLAGERETVTEKELCLEKCVEIHRRAKDRGLDSDVVLANTLVDVYGKCGSMDRAREVFDLLTNRDAVTWTSLIQGYVENNQSTVAVELFFRMDCQPDAPAFVSVLKACTSSATLPAGKNVHSTLCRLGLESLPTLANGLLDFYVKCGSMSTAEELFLGLESPDSVSWNIFMSGYSSCGDPSRVLSLVKEMHESGLAVNSVTFTSVLVACSHAGLVENAKVWLESLSSKLGVQLTVEHYNCMVDVLGRSNRLQEALELTRNMPFEPTVVTWRTLLGACNKWNNLEVGKAAFDMLKNIKASNIYRV